MPRPIPSGAGRAVSAPANPMHYFWGGLSIYFASHRDSWHKGDAGGDAIGSGLGWTGRPTPSLLFDK